MKKLVALFLTLSLMVVTLAGCSSGAEESSTSGSTSAESNTSAQTDGKTITLGLTAPITGTHAEYGVGFQAAVEIAMDEINNAGGVNGYNLAVEVMDSKGEPKETSDIVRQFAENDNIQAIIGDFTSSCSMAAAPIVDEAGIVLLSPTASNPDYPGMSDYTFTVMNNQSTEAPWFARAVVGQYIGAKSVAVMWLNTDWGIATHQYLLQGFEEAGITVVADESYAENETDFSSVISKLKSTDPECVVILDQGNVPTVINQIRGTGWDVQLATLGPGSSEQLIQLCGENAEGLIVDTPSFLTPENEEAVPFIDAFKEKTGYAPTDHSLCAYNSVYLLAESIKSIGDGEITREAIKDNLKTAQMDGLAGHVEFNEEGGCSRELLILQVENGKYVVKEDYGYGVE